MGQVIGIDTSILIYLLEEHPVHATKARRLFERFEKGTLQGIFSIVGMIELLTGVKKKADQTSHRIIKSFSHTSPF